MVLAAAMACEDKKADNVRILELDSLDSGFTDFFLIASGANDRQTAAIADEVELRIKRDFGTYPNSVEGRRLGEWILLDYVDFVVHVFLTERRAYYDIERLRKSAKAVEIAEFKASVVLKPKPAPKKTAAKRTAVKKTAQKVTARATKSQSAKRASARKGSAKKAGKPGPAS